MTDETGKQDETKPATNTTPKPSRRQIALLGAATPVLLTLPIRGARATYGGGGGTTETTQQVCGVCHVSTFSADPDYQDKTTVKYEWKSGKKYKVTSQYHYSCIGDDVIEHKTVTKIKVS